MTGMWSLLERRARTAAAAPFVTWYGPGNARAELSGVTYATSVAKTAGMLVTELDAAPGDRVRLALPLHWQLPVWLAACDVAGLEIVWPEPGSEPRGGAPGVDITVVADAADALPGGHTVVSAATPFGIPLTAVPDPLLDHADLSLGQPDRYAGPVRQGSWLVAGACWTPAGIGERARALAAQVGLRRGGRILIQPGTSLVTAALAVWAIPLLENASVVLVQAGDAARIGATERVTVTV